MPVIAPPSISRSPVFAWVYPEDSSPSCQLRPRPPSAPPSYCHCQIVRNDPSHRKPHPLVADLSKTRPLAAEAPPAVNRHLAFPRLVSVLVRSPTSCQLPPRLFLLLVPTPPLAAALPADTKSSVQPHFEPPCKTEPPCSLSSPEALLPPSRVVLLERFLCKPWTPNPYSFNVNQRRGGGQLRTRALGKTGCHHWPSPPPFPSNPHMIF